LHHRGAEIAECGFHFYPIPPSEGLDKKLTAKRALSFIGGRRKLSDLKSRNLKD
jgi:hypothetical protein